MKAASVCEWHVQGSIASANCLTAVQNMAATAKESCLGRPIGHPWTADETKDLSLLLI